MRRWALAILLGYVAVFGVPLPKSPTTSPTTRVTAAIYVYEKDAGPVPVGVYAGIDKLNRRGVPASLFEDDTTDGTGETPEQFKPALAAAKARSIPSLVVLSGTAAINVVEKPQTEADVLEAVP